MPPTRTRAALVLMLVALGSLGAGLVGAGFHVDDWVLLETAGSGGYWSALRSFAQGFYWARPPQIPVYALLFGSFNDWPLGGRLFLLACDGAAAVLLYSVLSALTRAPNFALLAAALTACYPNHGTTRLWLSSSPQNAALLLAMGSLRLHLLWLERGNRAVLAAGWICYLLGVLCYESAAFLPLLLWAGLWASGDRPLSVRAVWRAAAPLWSYPLGLLAVLAWKTLGLSFLPGASDPKSAAFSVVHALNVFSAGFECLANRTLHLCAVGLREALSEFSAAQWLALAALALAGARALSARDDRRTPDRVALALAAAAFLAGYLPYALTRDYMPMAFGVMNRVNAAAAPAGGLVLAWALNRLSAPRRFACLALLLGSFTTANWIEASRWAKAWSLERDILENAAAKLGTIPDPAVVLLDGFPGEVGAAPVFSAPYDFDAALRVTTGRAGLRGNLVTPGLRFKPEGAVCDAGGTAKTYPYGRLYIYRYDQDELRRVDGPPKP